MALDAAQKTGNAKAGRAAPDGKIDGGGAEADSKGGSKTGGIAADRLRSLVERIERLEEERKALSSDIKDIYLEGKSAGFDVKVLKTLISLRKKEPAEVEEQETLLDLYKRALGMG